MSAGFAERLADRLIVAEPGYRPGVVADGL
jgi:hypothetical protein